MRLEAILNPKQPPAKSALALMAAVCFAASTAAFVAVAAAQGPRGSSPLSTAPKIDITADQVVHSDPYDYIYKGRVAVRGLTEANVGLLTIDGRQARTADLALVEKAQFNTLKVTFSRNGPHPLERLDALSR
jgi:hypothetical protein